MSKHRDKVRRQIAVKQQLDVLEEADNLRASGRSKEARELLVAHGLEDTRPPDPKVEQAKTFLREGKGQELLDYMRDGHLTGVQTYELYKVLAEPSDDPAAEADRLRMLETWDAAESRADDIPVGQLGRDNPNVDWAGAERVHFQGGS